jgi:hypothetical protein
MRIKWTTLKPITEVEAFVEYGNLIPERCAYHKVCAPPPGMGVQTMDYT